MKRFALIGQPNTGKSSLFNRLTGLSQRVGNWPGLTVELAHAKLLLGGQMVELVDLPGIHDLSGYTEDEAVVRDVLSATAFDAQLIVLNASQLDRQLPLAIQAIATGIPALVVLNMADEAELLGIDIDTQQLAARLGAPVVLVSSKRMQGWDSFKKALDSLARSPRPAVSARLDAIADTRSAQNHARQALAGAWHLPPTLPARLSHRLDHYLMHPVLGLGLFVLIMALVFNGTYLLGGPLQDGLGSALDWLKNHWLASAVSPLPAWLQSLLLDGVWQGLSTVLTFAPILFVFFVLMALVEDSGYLARAAYLTDALMSRLGLDGRAFVMQLMGFGCNVPAIMGTRVMREKKQRLLSMLIIPFSLCSARLQVVVFFASTLFSPAIAPWVLMAFYAVSLAVAILTALVFKGKYCASEAYLMEVPPYRLPGIKHVLTRAYGEVRAFFELASTFILLGVVLVWLMTHIHLGGHTLADHLGILLAPVLDPIGIRHELAIALLFGFVAKEILLGSLAVIYGVSDAGLATAVVQHLDWVSAMSFVLFTLIYVPCLSTVAAIRRESHSLSFTVLSASWSVALAWVLCLAFYQITSRLV
ncbi:ferrous iron transport protein B [Craterilacuibacter sp. RT1T]|uniref:ferrous iron transport protein B n=1 Tax=Craterilacuibacter sp. RT1T TaxID=2942211 RepID=UPI0020BF01B7|nr:ferrous iron transport protein B [Craterilacuibacter sp. RT1T]MCL6262098.1 ferrous iron transport protein B [Craterilacuibacter sp. RT1T]